MTTFHLIEFQPYSFLIKETMEEEIEKKTKLAVAGIAGIAEERQERLREWKQSNCSIVQLMMGDE